MKTALFLIVLAISAITSIALPEQVKSERKTNQYTAADGGLTVFVVAISDETGRSESESRVEFKSADGKIACAIDYSSNDSEHGFGVVKAEWTPDSQYFVFSLSSSGGHQAWHAPTQFLSRKDGKIRALDDYVAAAGISNGDFRLIAPNTVKTEAWKGDVVPITLKLDALPKPSSWKKSKPLSLDCVGGRIIKPNQP